MDKNLALDLVRVTEVATIKAAQWLGKGDKNAADGAAVEGMRNMFNHIDVDGKIVIGEGEMDEAPMLYIGERVGNVTDSCEKIDIAVDPLDGTTIISKGQDHAISVIAVTPTGKMLHAPDMYMDKICVGPKGKGVVHLDLPLDHNIIALAKVLNKKVEDVTVVMLDRPRHDKHIAICRKLGCRVKLINDGDISTALATCFEDADVDLMIGSGGAPEGVLAAAAVKCLGGDFQGRLLPESQEEIDRCQAMGLEIGQLLTMEDLVEGDEVQFAATAVTDTDFMKGIRFGQPDIAITESVAMRAETNTIRYIKTVHHLTKKERYIG
ncbi:class II fructose-bisphosphatase [Erysipelotrichaceae bacterium OttesenSCG-928-M19]|nr:class II fructose-bisphosphatase [Erysipelotrichaceae bacterium OttesenSCG-928-M19]